MDFTFVFIVALAAAWKWPTMPALWSTMIAYVVLICLGTAYRWRRGPWRSIKMI